jgi:mono/diheme cytochrome c family protein
MAAAAPAGGAPSGAQLRPDRLAHHPEREYDERGHVGEFAWTDAQWLAHCRDVRTSYNPDHDLRTDALTLTPDDPRWPDFVFWTLDNKINEHQVEAYGGTGWKAPTGGVIFHWAPGSHWERDALHSFGFTIGHVIGEHRWTDTMFPDFFEKYGGVYGINLKDRLAELAPRSKQPWIDFLAYSGGEESPYGRYVLHINSAVNFPRRLVTLTAGQAIAFDYSFDRYYDELTMILTDCKAVDFFQMYDRFGRGFAAEGNWARQQVPMGTLDRVGFAHELETSGGGAPYAAGTDRAPSEEHTPVPADLPEADRMRRGEQIYYHECVMCHGVRGDGQGYLGEGFDVKPRDFTRGIYELRSTVTGELPTIEDVERTIQRGVPGTAMPAWGQFLDDQQIGDVARYLIVFSPRFTDAWRAHRRPQVLAVPPTPPAVIAIAAHPTGELQPCLQRGGEATITCNGDKLFKMGQCRLCHGDDRAGDGETARGLTDIWNHPVRPADLTYKWQFKHGSSPEDVYRAIFTGLDGSRMVSFATWFPSEAERWELVAYVLSLSPPVRPVLHAHDFAAQRAHRIGRGGRVVP